MFSQDARKVYWLLQYRYNTLAFLFQILGYDDHTYQLWNIIAFYFSSFSKSIFKIIIALSESSNE